MGVSALLRGCLSDSAMRAWGWRVPFLATVVLGALGLWLRHGLEDNEAEEADEGDENGDEEGEDEEGAVPTGDRRSRHGERGGRTEADEDDNDDNNDYEGGWGERGADCSASLNKALPAHAPHLYVLTRAVAAPSPRDGDGSAAATSPLTPALWTQTQTPTSPRDKLPPATPNPTLLTLTQQWRDVVLVVAVVSFWSVGFYR